jgi:hypothetical protein
MIPMHRMTPVNSAFRAYTAGGARATIDKIDDKKQMQESNDTGGMKNEQFPSMEAPQNYGFTSNVMPADKDDNGEVSDSAEAFLSFPGGNRSFAVASVMDDRRHRLKGMESGDSAMYRTAGDKQQYQLSKDGNFMTCRNDRVQRLALVPPDDEEQPPGGKQQGGGQQGQQQQKKKKTGQGPMLDENKKSEVYFEQNGGVTTVRHATAYSAQRGSDSSTYYEDRKKSTQVTADHSHLRTEDMRIFTDPGGCWSEVPILVKKDKYCKD